MELSRCLNSKDLAKFASVSLLALAVLPGCGGETASANNNSEIKNLQPGQKVTMYDGQVGIESSINRRSSPKVIPPGIAREDGGNIVYDSIEEIVRNPLILKYPVADYRASSETDWMSYISPKTNGQVFVVINGETIDRLSGLDPAFFKEVVVENVEIIKERGRERIAITVDNNGFSMLLAEAQTLKK